MKAGEGRETARRLGREQLYFSRGYAARAPGSTKPPSYAGYHLYKSVPFTEKRLRRSETGIKDGFQEMELEFPFVIFRPEKQDYLFRSSFAPGNFPLFALVTIKT